MQEMFYARTTDFFSNIALSMCANAREVRIMRKKKGHKREFSAYNVASTRWANAIAR